MQPQVRYKFVKTEGFGSGFNSQVKTSFIEEANIFLGEKGLQASAHNRKRSFYIRFAITLLRFSAEHQKTSVAGGVTQACENGETTHSLAVRTHFM